MPLCVSVYVRACVRACVCWRAGGCSCVRVFMCACMRTCVYACVRAQDRLAATKFDTNSMDRSGDGWNLKQFALPQPRGPSGECHELPGKPIQFFKPHPTGGGGGWEL